MICKKCGAIIKYKEEYCRKCGSLVINFNRVENKNVRDICIENNIRGKLRALINKISNKEAQVRKIKNKNHNYNKNHNFNKDAIEEIINAIKENLKLE